MLTFIAVGGPATSNPSCCPWLTGGWPRQFSVVITYGKVAGERGRTVRDVHIFLFVETGPLMQKRMKWVMQIFIFFGSWASRTFVRGSLWLSLRLSLVGSLWLSLCIFLDCFIVFSGSLSGSLTFSCSPWLALALICFGGPCFAFQPQSCIARNLPTLAEYQTRCNRYRACK